MLLKRKREFETPGAVSHRVATINSDARFAPLEEAIRCYRAAGDECAIVPTANLAETHYATGNFASA